MSKKLSYEDVYNYFKENNCELLETEYINNSFPMNYLCVCGNKSKISLKSFKRGSRCKLCGDIKGKDKQKYSYEYVYNYFKEHGCTLLDDNYINTHTKMRYQCSCGNISYIRFYRFKQHCRCRKCSGYEKHSIDFVKTHAIKNNYICLSDNYINNDGLLDYKCPNNHITKISFKHFQRGTRCKLCLYESRKGDGSPKWIPDRTRYYRTNYLIFNLRKIYLLKDDPNYENYIKSKEEKINLYEIDHIFPRIAFIDNNLDKQYDPKIIKEICNSVDNLKIVTKSSNRNKSSKYNQEEFMNWFNNKLQNYKDL